MHRIGVSFWPLQIISLMYPSLLSKAELTAKGTLNNFNSARSATRACSSRKILVRFLTSERSWEILSSCLQAWTSDVFAWFLPSTKWSCKGHRPVRQHWILHRASQNRPQLDYMATWSIPLFLTLPSPSSQRVTSSSQLVVKCTQYTKRLYICIRHLHPCLQPIGLLSLGLQLSPLGQQFAAHLIRFQTVTEVTLRLSQAIKPLTWTDSLAHLTQPFIGFSTSGLCSHPEKWTVGLSPNLNRPQSRQLQLEPTQR